MITPAVCSRLPRCARRTDIRQIFLYRHTRCRYLNSDTKRRPGSLLTLAIETSCDDTCVAILEKSGPAARLLFNKKTTSNNIAFRGVHPIAAVESHTSQLAPLVRDALQSLPQLDSGDTPTFSLPVRDAATGETSLRRLPDFISVTRGPGMLNGLGVGLTMAKGLAVAWQLPLVGVHHMQAHALTPRLVNALDQPWTSSSSLPSTPPSPSFPFLTLLVSGGHTQLVLSRSLTSHTILADKLNVAIGDMLDKCGRDILPSHITASSNHVMYGAQLEVFAFPSTNQDTPSSSSSQPYSYTPPPNRAAEIKSHQSLRRDWILTPPLSTRGRFMAYDFSGLGGQVQAITQQWQSNPSLEEDDHDRRELAKAVMQLAFEHLASRVVFALQDMQPAKMGRAMPSSKQVEGAKDREKRRSEDNKPIPDLENPRQQLETEGNTDENSQIKTLVLSGGVASNQFLRAILREVLDVRGFSHVQLVAPPVALCTDNAAMIAWTGTEMYEAGWESELEILPVRKWSFDPVNEGGGGVLELGGWRRRDGFE